MYCGLSPKGRCMQVKEVKDISEQCEVNHTTKQKRCRRKTVTDKPKEDKPTKKVCPPGKVLNPKTNRCIKKPIKKTTKKPIKKTTKKKVCPPGKVLNPKTNRCIINRKLDEEDVIDFKYKCKPGEIYNPESKRCIKKDSPIKKKIMITNVTDKIGGPISLHYYQFEFGGIMRHFLLFGDKHTQYVEHESPDIIEIPTLIKKIIRRSPHCIDIYSENPIYHGRAMGKKLQKYNNPLVAIRNEFGHCPIHNLPGAACNYDNLRYQNWDLRFGHKKGKHTYKSNPYEEVLMSYPQVTDDINKKFNKKDIILYILGFTKKMKKATEKKIDKFFDDMLAVKYLRESFSEGVADRDMFQKRRNLIQKEYKKCLKSNKFPKDLLEVFIANFIRVGDDNYTLVFTDFYMICRMFMNFDKNKKTPKKCPIKGKNNYKTPEYSILYAGDLHVRDVFSFFESMFDVKPIYTTRHNYPNGKSDKLIGINHIKDKNGKKLKDISTVDDLFKDFY